MLAKVSHAQCAKSLILRDKWGVKTFIRGGNRKNDLYASESFLQGKEKTDFRQTLLMKIAIIGHFENLG